MNWLVYLVDGRKVLLTEKEYKNLLVDVDFKSEIIEGEEFKSSKQSIYLEGVEVESAVREDCDSMVPSTQQKERVRN